MKRKTCFKDLDNILDSTTSGDTSSGEILTDSGAFTVPDTTDVVRVVGASTVTLPDADNVPGKTLTIVNIGANAVTVNADIGDFIDDAVTTSISLSLDREHVTLRNDGDVTWLVI